jgi:hypothetical protein
LKATLLLCLATPLLAQNSANSLKPSWWNKFLYLYTPHPCWRINEMINSTDVHTLAKQIVSSGPMIEPH